MTALKDLPVSVFQNQQKDFIKHLERSEDFHRKNLFPTQKSACSIFNNTDLHSYGIDIHKNNKL
jgi:cyclopropane fatty-acyl-phospholipid synthase-like methyltransferase